MYSLRLRNLLTETSVPHEIDSVVNLLDIPDDDSINFEPENNELNIKNDVTVNHVLPTQSLLLNFKQYVAKAYNEFKDYTDNQVNAINLLAILRQATASLSTYEALMHWHFVATKAIHFSEPVSRCPLYVPRPRLFKFLENRFSFGPRTGLQETSVLLPHSRANATIVWKDAKSVITSLLTDPRIRDEDYLFWNNDPFSGPPDQIDTIGDLNTGNAYVQSYKRLIRGDKQVLLPVLFYIDGANTGHFVDLPITAVKISLGIFTQKARDKDYMWQTLGYIPAVDKYKHGGTRMVRQSGHLDAVLVNNANFTPTACKAQDLHTMLDVVLRSYYDLQHTGFVWDLKYQNRVYKGIEFVLFTPFIK